MAWAGAVCAGAAALAGFAQRVRWLFIVGLLIGCLAFALLLAAGIPDVVGWLKERAAGFATQRRRPRPAFTGRWRHTTEGTEVPSLMTTLQKGLSHPGYMSGVVGESPPSVRIGVIVACGPLGSTPTTSDLRSAFLCLLRRPPVWDLIKELTYVNTDVSWRNYASNGRINNGAVLTASDEETEAPVVSALLNLNEDGTHLWGLDSRCAEMLLLVQPRDEIGQPAPPLTLKHWFDVLVKALELPAALGYFLSTQVGTSVHDDPPAQLGIRLDSYRGIGSLVDPGQFMPIAGSSMTSSFLSYMIAERAGAAPQQAAVEMLRVWCDHGLHIDGYEGILARLPGPVAPDHS
jgi:hypothetical protein